MRKAGEDSADGERPEPPTATDAIPGSEAKVAVMAARVAMGFAPHHADDPTQFREHGFLVADDRDEFGDGDED